MFYFISLRYPSSALCFHHSPIGHHTFDLSWYSYIPSTLLIVCFLSLNINYDYPSLQRKCPDSLHTPILFPEHLSSPSLGLVDSSSSHCFADPSFIVSSYLIPPVILCLLDSLVGTVIDHAADILVRFSTNDILLVKFYITKLDSSSGFVFGHNWLHHYNLLIDWSASQILYFRKFPLSIPNSARSGPNGSSEPPVSSSTTSASDLKPSVTSDS